MRQFRALGYELLFLWRYGFVYAYLFVLAVYTGIILAVPAGPGRSLLSLILIYSDISMLGFIFMGASLHLEAQSGVISALGISPVPGWRLILGRCAAMSILAGTIGSVLFILGCGLNQAFPLFLLGAIGCSATFTCFGISLMTRSGNLSRYIILAGVISMPVGIPVLHLFGLLDGPLLYLLPGGGGLVFMESALKGREGISLLAALINLLLWLCASLLLSARDFRFRLVEGRRHSFWRAV